MADGPGEGGGAPTLEEREQEVKLKRDTVLVCTVHISDTIYQGAPISFEQRVWDQLREKQVFSWFKFLAALYLPLVRVTVRNRWITVRNRWITVRNWWITIRNRWITVGNGCHFRIWAQIVTFETFVRNDD